MATVDAGSSVAQQIRKDWYQERIQEIHKRVTSYDVLRMNGVQLDGSDARELQFSCPFHGIDRKPSARVYPESERGPSHAWCYVCQERWDVISLWMKFNGSTFGSAIAELERTYGLTTPPMPDGMREYTKPAEESLDAFNTLFEACERRLIGARPAYAQLNDLKGYISAGSILDKLHSKVMDRRMPASRAQEVLQQLLERIGQKMRASTV